MCGVGYGLSIMLTKVSILVFYLRFSLHRAFRIVVYADMAVVILYSLVGTFEWLYACKPISKSWDLTISTGSCINQVKLFIFSGAMNTITDVVTLILPVIMMWGVQLPLRQKIGVIFVFLTGGL